MRIAYDAYANSFGGKTKYRNNGKIRKNTENTTNNITNNNTSALSNLNRVYLDNIKSIKHDVVQVTFTGNSAKNSKQVVNICPEVKGFFNDIYASGGLGDVTNEYSQAMVRHGGMDVRTIVPYHSFYNTVGNVRAVRFIEEKAEDGISRPVMVKTPDGKEVQKIEFFSTTPNAQLQSNESFVIHGPYEEGQEHLAKYKLLDKLETQGTVKQIGEDFTRLKQVPYYVFTPKAGHGVIDHPIYFLHVPGCGSWNHSYNAGPQGGAYAAYGAYSGACFEDYQYGIFAKAAEDFLPQMKDNEEFNHISGNFGKGFNPQSIAFHDRQAFVGIPYLTELSATGAHDGYYNGLKMHGVFHNPTRAYQGHYNNPIDFFQIVASENDWNNLKATNEDGYNYVCKAVKKINEMRAKNTGKFLEANEILSKQEMTNLNEIFKPYIGQFMDGDGEYNLCMLAIKNAQENFENATCGTVSTNFGKEMQNPETPEIAEGLTREFRKTRTVNIVNGSAPSTLGLEKGGKIGKGTLNTGNSEGYLPLRPELFSVTTEKEELAEAQRLINAIIDESKEKEYFEHAENYIANQAKEKAANEAMLKGLSKEQAKKYINDEVDKAVKETGAHLTERLEHFKSLYKNGSTLDEIKGQIDSLFNVKERNKEWIIDVIARACKSSENSTTDTELSALEKLFIDPAAMFTKDADGRAVKNQNYPEVLGSFTPYKKDDMLFIGWGRGDDQKGFAVGIQGAIKYLEENPDDYNTKFIFGGGGWSHDSYEYKLIKKLINNMEKNEHKGQIIYVNSFFPNKLVACSDYGYFTSRYEPCGITPFQAYSAGCPIISNNTGGAPDFVEQLANSKENITSATGFLTKHPYMLSKEALKEILGDRFESLLEDAKRTVAASGLEDSAQIEAKILDTLRMQVASEEEAECIKLAVDLYRTDKTNYKQMMRNTSNQQIDWHTNSAYNGGKSAMQRYLDDVFTINKPIEQSPLRKLIGENAVTTYRKATVSPSLPSISYTEGLIKKTGKGGKIGVIVATAAAFLFGIYSIYKREKNQSV